MFIPIEGLPMVRDTNSHGVASTDSSALTQAKVQKAKILALQNEVANLRRDLDKVLEILGSK